MNLEKLLAANMIRFGVKNLTEQLHKTLLNEGLSPGQATPEFKTQDINSQELAPKLLPKVQAYAKGPLRMAAIEALATGVSNLIKKDKKLAKTFTDYNTDTLWNIMTADASGGTMESPWVPLIDSAAAFTYEKTEVSVYPKPGDPSYVATMGNLGGQFPFKVQNSEKQVGTNYNNIIRYFNSFNLANVLEGDFTQYRLSDMIDQNNHINFLTVSPLTNTVIVYTATNKIPGSANKTVGTTTQGATAPIDKVYDVNFAQSVATVPPNDPEVAKAIADAIAMFPDGNISNLSVVSSASPEYGAITNVPGWEKSYPKGITGTGNPGNGTDDASKNIKLAYDRGVNFVAAINAGLAAQGKPEMVNTSIKWQISDTGGSPNSLGRFSNVNWSKAGTPGTEVGNMKDTGTPGDATQGKETFTIFQHVFTCVS